MLLIVVSLGLLVASALPEFQRWQRYREWKAKSPFPLLFESYWQWRDVDVRFNNRDRTPLVAGL